MNILLDVTELKKPLKFKLIFILYGFYYTLVYTVKDIIVNTPKGSLHEYSGSVIATKYRIDRC